MNLVIEALRLRWPDGIPAQDYEKMLSVVHVFGDTPAPATKKRKSHRKVGAPTVERVRRVLESGPLAVHEISEVLGTDATSVYAALRQLGAVADGKTTRSNGGSTGAYPNLWRLPAE